MPKTNKRVQKNWARPKARFTKGMRLFGIKKIMEDMKWSEKRIYTANDSFDINRINGR